MPISQFRHPCFSSYPNRTTSQVSSIDSYFQSSLTFAEQFSQINLSYRARRDRNQCCEPVSTKFSCVFIKFSIDTGAPFHSRMIKGQFEKNAVKPWSCMQDILHYFFWLCTHLHRLSPFFEGVCKTNCDARTYTEFALMEMNRKISHSSL